MGIVIRFLILSTTESFTRAFANASGSANSYVNAINSANTQLRQGKVFEASQIFDSSIHFFDKNEYFQHEFISFLMKTGQYERVSVLKNVISKEDALEVEKAKGFLDIIKSNNIEAISKLYNISPYSFDVNMAYIKSLILQKSYNSAEQSADLLAKYYPNRSEPHFLKVYAMFLLGKYKEFCANYNGNSFFRSYVMIVTDMLNLEKSAISRNQKFSQLIDLYRSSNRILFNSLMDFDPIKVIIIKLLEGIVTTGIDLHQKVSFYAQKLLSYEETPTSISLYIKTLVYENSYEYATGVLNKYKSVLNEASIRHLQSFISLSKKNFEDQAREREENERKRREDQMRTQNAGKDFLGHYGNLGLKPGASTKEVEKAYKSKLREVQRTAKKKKLSTAEKDQLLKTLNMAKSVLLDSKKKDLYDRGFDPAQAPPSSNSHHNHARNNGYGEQRFHFDGDDIFKDFFQGFFQQAGGNSFFGGGNQGNGRRYRQQRVVYIN